jgi:dienelactone hydrolase
MSYTESVNIPMATGIVRGDLVVPLNTQGLVIFAHGSGSGRLSPRNQMVAKLLNQKGLATLLMDLLTAAEETEDAITAQWRFDINFLSRRLQAVSEWTLLNSKLKDLPVGYFGASTGAAAALTAAAPDPKIRAVVSRGGRPDLAMSNLIRVQCPTLLLVGGMDSGVIELNKKAYDMLNSVKRLSIIPGATHLFEETGALEQVAELAGAWFLQYLPN